MTHCEKCGEELVRSKCMSPYGGYLDKHGEKRYWDVLYRCPVWLDQPWQKTQGHTNFIHPTEREYS